MPIIELPSLIVDHVVAISDADRPVLINRDPGPDETGVPLDWPIALEIVDPGPDGIDRAATQIWINGNLAFDNVIQPGFNGPRAEVVESADTLRIVLGPLVPFESEAAVEAHVVSATNGGTNTLDETYSFKSEDRTAPMVVAAHATGSKTVEIGFDEDIDIINIVGFSFTPVQFPAVPVSPIEARADGQLAIVVLNTEMTPDIRYRVTVFGVTDKVGNPVLPPYDSVEFVGFRPPRPVNRRFHLWKMLPKHNRRSDDTGDLWRFIACLQEITDLLLFETDRFVEIFDIERAPEPFLDLILDDLGNPFHFNLGELDKRRLASLLVKLYEQKGTAIGIKNALRFFLGIEVEVLSFAADTLILGESELGVDWILGPSDRFARYAFSLRADVPLTEQQRKQIRAIVDYLKVSHTHFVDLIEPSSPETYDHWELGISLLGETALLH